MKTSGLVFMDGREVGETRQCVHCGRQWVWEHGSGKRRGFCTNCGGITCGTPGCHPCLPFEKKLDLYEKGKLSALG